MRKKLKGNNLGDLEKKIQKAITQIGAEQVIRDLLFYYNLDDDKRRYIKVRLRDFKDSWKNYFRYLTNESKKDPSHAPFIEDLKKEISKRFMNLDFILIYFQDH